MNKIRGETNWFCYLVDRMAQRAAPGSTQPVKPKSMPLPNVGLQEEGVTQEEGMRRIDRLMTPETVENLRQMYPELEGLSYVRSGADGLAYECSPGVMCKFTKHFDEADVANRVMVSSPSGAPRIESVSIIQENPSLWVIQMEKVRMLSNREKYLFGSVHGHMPVMVGGELEHGLYMANNRIDTWNENVGGWGYEKAEPIDRVTLEELREMNRVKVEMKQSLRSIGVTSNDDHPGNIGWASNPDRLVMFDFSGESRIES